MSCRMFQTWHFYETLNLRKILIQNRTVYPIFHIRCFDYRKQNIDITDARTSVGGYMNTPVVYTFATYFKIDIVFIEHVNDYTYYHKIVKRLYITTRRTSKC